jgi:hypothetical protein
VVNVPAAYNGFFAMFEEQVEACREAPLGHFVEMDFAIAIVHILFAAYLKHQVIYGYRAPPDAFDASQAAVVASMSAQTQTPTSAEVGERVKSIAMYDIGFCLYFFVFFGSFGYQFYGFDYGHRCDLMSWRTWNMTCLLMLYPFLTLGYTCIFLCFTGLKAGVERGTTMWNQRQGPARASDGAPYVALASAPVQPAMQP